MKNYCAALAMLVAALATCPAHGQRTDDPTATPANPARNLKRSKQASAAPAFDLAPSREHAIRRQVEAEFARRQQQQRAELKQLQRQLMRIEQSIAAREKVKKKIIDRRVEALLHPELDWGSKPAAPRRATDLSNPYGSSLDPSANRSDPFGRSPDPSANRSDPFGRSPDPSANPSDLLPSKRKPAGKRGDDLSVNSKPTVGSSAREATELRKRIEDLKAELQLRLRLRKNSTDQIHSEIVEKSRRDLATLRDELATHIRLIELELQDANSALDVAKQRVARVQMLAEQKIISKSELDEATRKLTPARVRVERGRALLDLYRKVDSPATSTPDDSEAAMSAEDKAASQAVIATLRKRLKLLEVAYRNGDLGVTDLFKATIALHQEEFELAANAEQRKTALMARFEALQKLHKAVQARVRTGHSPQADVLAVEAELLKAEAALGLKRSRK